MAEDLFISRERVLPAASLTVRAVRASGPGGQHVNRTESKIQLVFDPRMVPWLDEGTRLRIVALAGRNVDAEGRIHIAAQEHREKERNLEDALAKLKELVAKALVRPKKRIPTKPTKASKRRRLDDKRRTSERKQGRGRVQGD